MPKRPPLQVDKADLANLRESGLTDATIRANKLRTEKRELVFPYRDLDGTVNCFARCRPHKPRVIDGKPVKYEQPKGTPLRAYYPAASVPMLRSGSAPIYITEGEKKALALSQLKLAAIGIGGIYSWKKKGTDELIDDLLDIVWEGRDVYIVFDYDAKPDTRLQVDGARRRLAKALRVAGAEVYSIELPPGPNGAKQGVDDYIVAHDAAAFHGLVERAEPISIIKIIPPALGTAAYHGLIGEFLRAIAPYTEATDAGILAHLLPAIATLVGPGPHVFAGSPQPARIDSVVVGPTSTGRKGTAAAPVEMLLQGVDKEFWLMQRVGGLSSGEGLITKVSDRREKNDDGVWETIPVEKRLYVLEPEFSRVLANTRRDTNILSQVIRESFDSGNLSTLTVSPRNAFGAHISIVAHITPEELSKRFYDVEAANGFGNRFLWFYVESDKLLPHTNPIPDSIFIPFEKRLRTILDLGSKTKSLAVKLEPAASAVWENIYFHLREDRPGLAGAMVARGSSIVLRLALVYCLLDRWQSANKAPRIAVEHLEAALAVWSYCEQSAMQLFRGRGEDAFANKLLALLSTQPMTKHELNKHLSPRQKTVVDKTLAILERSGQVQRSIVKHSGAGRPAKKWERVG